MSSTTIQTIVTHNEVKYHGEYATIEHTMLGFEDHGLMTAQLQVGGPGWGQGVGGYNLGRPADGGGSEGTAFGMDQVMQILRVVGVGSWEALEGSPVLVLYTYERGPKVVGLASPYGTRALVFAEHAAAWKDRP